MARQPILCSNRHSGILPSPPSQHSDTPTRPVSRKVDTEGCGRLPHGVGSPPGSHGSIGFVHRVSCRSPISTVPATKISSVVENTYIALQPRIAQIVNSRRESMVCSGTYCGYSVSYTHLRAHETDSYLVCRLLL